MTPTCTLKVISGPAAGSEIEVEHELIIGRRETNLTIADDEISRPHAAVRPLQTGVIVEDLGSLNGTFVNGERIDGPVTLTADTTIRVGQSELSLQVAVALTAPPEEQAEDVGRTRVVAAVPPEPIPQPQVTRVRPNIPGEHEPQAPEPIPQPQVTRVRPIPGEQGQKPQAPEPIPQPQVTRVRPIPGEHEPAPQPQVTQARSAIPEEQAEPPGMFKRLLGRILGRGGSEAS